MITEGRNDYKILLETSQRMRPLGRTWVQMEDSVAMNVRDAKYDFVEGIELGIQRHAFVNIVMTSG